MEHTIIGLSLFANLLFAALLSIDVREIDRLRTELRITKRKLDRYKRREVSFGFDSENEE